MARKELQTCIVGVRFGEEHGEDAEETYLVPFIEDLEAAVEEAECGEFDRDEFDGTWHRLIFIGPDAVELREVLEEVIAGSPLEQDVRIIARGGSTEDTEEEDEVELEG
jgi:hypothetical protein